MRGQIQLGVGVRESVLPASNLGVVVTVVTGVPTEYNVAKTKATFGCTKEFILVQIFATQDTVDI